MSVTGRTRERTPVEENVTCSIHNQRSSAGSCSQDASAPLTISETQTTCRKKFHTDEMSDVVTSDYYKIIKSGGIVNNDMSKEEVIETRNPLGYYRNYKLNKVGCTPSKEYTVYHYRRTGDIDPDTFVRDYLNYSTLYMSPNIGNFDQSIVDRAVAQAFARIGIDEMLFLATLAETNKSIDGLLQIMKKVLGIFMALKRLDPKAIARQLSPKEVSEIYMNARYNLRPLMYDAAGIVNTLGAGKRRKRRTFRSRMEDSLSESEQNAGILVLPDVYQNSYQGVSRTYEREGEARAGVLTEMTLQSNSQLLGIDKIGETAFELVPFSFIVNWFCNVCDVVGAWTPKVGFDVLAAWSTLRTTERKTVSFFGPDIDDTGYTGAYDFVRDLSFETSGGECEYVVKRTVRDSDPSRPILPTIRLNLDCLKLLDLAIIGRKLRDSSPRYRG